MEVVIEYVLLNNFVIDFLIIKTTTRILKCSQNKYRLCIASLAGSICSVCYPLVYDYLHQLICKVFVCFMVVLIAFDIKTIKDFALKLLTFLFSSAIYGGFTYLILQMFGINSLKLSSFPIFFVYFCLAVYAVIIYNFISFLNKQKSYANFRYLVKIFNGENVYESYAYLDSGNLLVDNKNGNCVVVINYRCFEKLYGSKYLMKIIKKEITNQDISGCHYIDVQSLAGKNKMLILPVDKFLINGIERENISLGLSLSKFKFSFKTDVILNVNCFVED